MSPKQFRWGVGLLALQLLLVLAHDAYARKQEREVCRHAIQRAFLKTRADAEKLIEEQHTIEGY